MVHLVNLLKLLKIQQFFKKSGNKDKLINIDEISNNEKDMNESDEFSDDINNKEIGDLEKDNNIANEINDGILDIDVNINHSDLNNFGSSSGEENIGLINKTNLDKLENCLQVNIFNIQLFINILLT